MLFQEKKKSLYEQNMERMAESVKEFIRQMLEEPEEFYRHSFSIQNLYKENGELAFVQLWPTRPLGHVRGYIDYRTNKNPTVVTLEAGESLGSPSTRYYIEAPEFLQRFYRAEDGGVEYAYKPYQ